MNCLEVLESNKDLEKWEKSLFLIWEILTMFFKVLPYLPWNKTLIKSTMMISKIYLKNHLRRFRNVLKRFESESESFSCLKSRIKQNSQYIIMSQIYWAERCQSDK
jgi:hypothetical protein